MLVLYLPHQWCSACILWYSICWMVDIWMGSIVRTTAYMLRLVEMCRINYVEGLLMDPTQPVWEIFVMILLLLIGVSYSIVYIMRYDDMVDGKTEGVTDGSDDTSKRKSCYNFRVIKINRVVDGDTIDVTIDLGFDLYKKRKS